MGPGPSLIGHQQLVDLGQLIWQQTIKPILALNDEFLPGFALSHAPVSDRAERATLD